MREILIWSGKNPPATVVAASFIDGVRPTVLAGIAYGQNRGDAGVAEMSWLFTVPVRAVRRWWLARKRYRVEWLGRVRGLSWVDAESPEEARERARRGYDEHFEETDIVWEPEHMTEEGVVSDFEGEVGEISYFRNSISPFECGHPRCAGGVIRWPCGREHAWIRDGCVCNLCFEANRLHETYRNTCYCTRCIRYLIDAHCSEHVECQGQHSATENRYYAENPLYPRTEP